MSRSSARGQQRRALGSRVDGSERTPEVQASAEILDLHPQHPADAHTAAVLLELRAVHELLANIEQRLLCQPVDTTASKVMAPVLSDDSIVDQRSVPAPRDLYLRLARTAAFPSRKLGKRILARWGDVRAAFLCGPGLQKTQGRAEERSRCELATGPRNGGGPAKVAQAVSLGALGFSDGSASSIPPQSCRPAFFRRPCRSETPGSLGRGRSDTLEAVPARPEPNPDPGSRSARHVRHARLSDGKVRGLGHAKNGARLVHHVGPVPP